MLPNQLPLNQIIQGDCSEILNTLPENCVDLIFADPPYNLQLQNDLWRPNNTKVDAVDDDWDHFSSLSAYDNFTRRWLAGCRRVLKDTGTIWVIGSYHNIYRIGSLMQDLGFWFLNDVIWIKTNPMPNFRGVRFANAHETLLWASKKKGARYTFNHHAMKSLNDGKQMRSDWRLPICKGSERLRKNGHKVHSTQKPLSLLYRVILSSSNPGDLVLDPFFGTGTTGLIARLLHRDWIGIEKEPDYINIARQRIDQSITEAFDPAVFEVRSPKKLEARVPFHCLIEAGLLKPGQSLFFRGTTEFIAKIKPDGKVQVQGFVGSIHQAGKHLLNESPCNGWDVWCYQDESGAMHSINELRDIYRKNSKSPSG
jgi:modification methylase